MVILKKKLYRMCIELTNNSFTSNTLKNFTQSKYSKYLNKSFAKVFSINLNEMEKDLSEYNSLHEFFTRNLKEGARDTNKEVNSITSPVDGILESFGDLNEQTEFLVKGQLYSLQEMFTNKDDTLKYQNGKYMVIYLSPSHYHRIHSPISGYIKKQWVLGGKSYPVNQLGLKYGKKPLTKNFRKITEIEYKENKHLLVAKIGAMNINSIETTFKDKNIKKGQEIGYFSFGSTVILLFEKNTIEFNKDLKSKQDLFMGNKIAQIK